MLQKEPSCRRTLTVEKERTATWQSLSTPASPITTDPSSTLRPVDGSVAVDMDVSEYGVSLAWSDLSCVRHDAAGDVVLRHLDGILKPGESLAVLSPTPEERLLLLNVLAGRELLQLFDGDVLVDGCPDDVKPISNYIVNEDSLIDVFTVAETLLEHVELGMPHTIARRDSYYRAHVLLRDFQLEGIKHHRLGESLFSPGLSPGLRRRVLIASQMPMKKPINLLIEPTEGLNEVETAELIQVLASITRRGRLCTVCAMNHPSSQTLDFFDKVLIFCQGRTLYFGPPRETAEYFSRLGFPTLPGGSVSVYVQQFSATRGDESAKRLVDHLSREWEASNEAVEVKAQVALEQTMARLTGKIDENIDPLKGKKKKRIGARIAADRRYPTGWFTQVYVLLRREIVQMRRSVRRFWIRLMFYAIMAVVVGTIWVQVGTSEAQIPSRVFAFFVSVSVLSAMSLFSASGLSKDHRRAIGECAVANLYSAAAYAAAQSAVLVVSSFLMAMAYSALVYYIAGFNPNGAAFGKFLLVLWETVFISESIVALAAAMTGGVMRVLCSVALVTTVFILSQRHLFARALLPRFWQLVQMINYQSYSVEALVLNDMTGLAISCAKSGSKCHCSIPSSLRPSTCAVSGLDVLNWYGYARTDVLSWMLILLDMALVLRILHAGVFCWRVGLREPPS